MKTRVKLLFTSISIVLILIGLLAIVTKTHVGYSRFEGFSTVIDDEAIWFGETCLLLAVLPLLVWLPGRWIGFSVSVWWIALMAWLFVPFALR